MLNWTNCNLHMKTGESIEITPHMVPSFTSIEKKTVNCVSIVYKKKHSRDSVLACISIN